MRPKGLLRGLCPGVARIENEQVEQPAGHLCRGERTDPSAERAAGAARRDSERLDCLPRALERDEGGRGCGLRVEESLGRSDRERQRLERSRDRQLAIERERAEIEKQPDVTL